MKIEIIKCPRGCNLTFYTKNAMLNHHLEAHQKPLPERYGIDLPPIRAEEWTHRLNGEDVR